MPALVAALLAACTAPTVRPSAPIEPVASAHLYDAWRAERHAPDGVTAAVPHARAAAAAAPGWVAPERVLDDAARAALLAPEAYAARIAALASAPEDPAAHYLIGRFGGPTADQHLARAVDLDPTFGWGWHGLAWNAHRLGDTARALRLGEAALELARDPHEVAHFGLSLARYLVAAERADEAVALLDALATGRGARRAALLPRDEERAQLALERTLGELSANFVVDGVSAALRRGASHGQVDAAAVRARAAESGLALLAGPGLTASERASLATALLRTEAVPSDELLLALVGAGETALAAEVLGLRGGSALAEAWSTPERAPRPRAVLTRSFRSGEPLPLFLAWVAELPRWLVDVHGEPLHPPLRALLAALERAYPLATATPAARAALGEALLAAGWFDEAEGLVLRGALPEELAASVLARALAARTTFQAIGRTLAAIDAQRGSELVAAPGRPAALARVRDVDGLLDAVARHLAQRRALAGQGSGSSDLAARSPRIRYGPFAEVVHPGPTFSAEDERLGRGRRGDPVPGLAAELLALGRHGLFGVAVGQGGPDGAVLRIVHVEERDGEHLGRPFRGTVFWCDGADVPARFARRGASISGAALHEGYWIDLDRIEAERDGWRRIEQRFRGAPERVRAALDVRGVPATGAARAALVPALGAADRMRLAWMVEHGSEAEPALVSLGALAEVVAVHEEGHLCDRAAWYPLRANFGALLAFAAGYGFAPERIAEALEERAQLVALCCAEDPRLAWIDVLDAAERAATDVGRAVTPHAAGYRRVLQRLLLRLGGEADAGLWPELDPRVRWIDQLHRVDPERLRELARREAVRVFGLR